MRDWISVKDKFPEVGITGVYASDWVIGSDGEDVYMVKFIKLRKQHFWKEIYTESLLSITHWIPLPAPPIIDDESEKQGEV